MTPRTAGQVVRFGIVGSIGFVVDAAVLVTLNSLAGLNLVPARFWSFGVAVSVTWYLNRRLTFATRKYVRPFQQWLYYASTNGIGALLNLAVFMWLVFEYSVLAANPVLPLAVASLIAMVFNFLVSKYFVFSAVGDEG